MDYKRLYEELLIRYKALEDAVMTDTLTGCKSRKFFDEYLKDQVSLMRRNNRSLVLCLFDIDHFKEYNDKYGHLEGDKALNRFGIFASSYFRKEDAVCRYGGEEFALIMPNTTSKGIRGKIEEFRGDVAVLHKTFLLPRQITLSYGLVEEKPSQMTAMEEIVRRADNALYEAKTNGRNRGVIWQAGI